MGKIPIQRPLPQLCPSGLSGEVPVARGLWASIGGGSWVVICSLICGGNSPGRGLREACMGCQTVGEVPVHVLFVEAEGVDRIEGGVGYIGVEVEIGACQGP